MSVKNTVKECCIVTTLLWLVQKNKHEKHEHDEHDELFITCSGLDATECIFYDYSSLFATI